MKWRCFWCQNANKIMKTTPNWKSHFWFLPKSASISHVRSQIWRNEAEYIKKGTDKLTTTPHSLWGLQMKKLYKNFLHRPIICTNAKEPLGCMLIRYLVIFRMIPNYRVHSVFLLFVCDFFLFCYKKKQRQEQNKLKTKQNWKALSCVILCLWTANVALSPTCSSLWYI